VPARVAIVTSPILDRPTCLDGIAQRSSLSLDDADAVLTRITAVLAPHHAAARCRVCGEIERLFSIERPRR
jgi:hypothetical protein